MVQFRLPKLKWLLRRRAKVCWTNDKGQSGLLFLYLHSDVRPELHAWIAQKLEDDDQL